MCQQGQLTLVLRESALPDGGREEQIGTLVVCEGASPAQSGGTQLARPVGNMKKYQD